MIISYLANLNFYQELARFNQLLVGIPADLTSQETLAELQARAALAVKYSQVGQAYKLLKQLQSGLFKQNQSTQDQYEPIMVWLQYASLPDLAPGEMVDFFQKFNFTIILNDEDFNDLAGMLRVRLGLEDINERDGLREKVYNAMHANQKVIVEFSSASGTRTTVADWLKLYDSAIGLPPAKSIAIAEFNNKNIATFKLDDNSKILWKRLVEFYEYVKLSSSDAMGFEEDIIVEENGITYLLSNGEKIDLSRVASELKPLTSAPLAPPDGAEAAAFAAALPLMPDIVKQAQAYLTATNGDVAKVTGELQTALAGANVLSVAGALVLLALLRRLDDILGEEPSFRALVAQDLEQSGQGLQSEGLTAHPNAPQFLARFLKVILQDNLHISAEEAVAFGGRLGELMALENEMYRRLIITDEQGFSRWNM